ncbi:carboxymuconolactone decarboxylase family protein [Streptomyces roseicoloratus]|uniref:Carboxymuconolactone decarboxylase family protein n=1 Tax=Streptomyces roseicoloratus TaxID=2508722 RepID=A0ABY9RYU2_9ACTN|nr:carboxymuconolactone decarboxylase family protein [Streptomyces roseicoloratus]WMX46666.1 carboxymuconolactone decarboxylase family protein [Streptomyces roseicoloratus]
MEPRLNPFASAVTTKLVKHLAAAGKALNDTGLPMSTQELVKIRASQINGCAFCLDMHTKEAEAAGETTQRLLMVGAWREANVFTEAERAALELTEAGTRLADGTGIPDDVWQNAAKYYDEDQLLALVGLVAIINAFNRMNVMLQMPGGDYKVGQFA